MLPKTNEVGWEKSIWGIQNLLPQQSCPTCRYSVDPKNMKLDLVPAFQEQKQLGRTSTQRYRQRQNGEEETRRPPNKRKRLHLDTAVISSRPQHNHNDRHTWNFEGDNITILTKGFSSKPLPITVSPTPRTRMTAQPHNQHQPCLHCTIAAREVRNLPVPPQRDWDPLPLLPPLHN